MSGFAKKALRESRNATFPLQITSMIDMLTIILVYLLKSFAASSLDISPSKNMVLPASTSINQPSEALRLMVTKEGIFLGDKPTGALVSFGVDGRLPASIVDKRDGRFISPLYNALVAEADKTKAIAAKNETVKFEGRLIFQADRSLSYDIIKKVMYTASMAGYQDFKLAVVSLQ